MDQLINSEEAKRAPINELWTRLSSSEKGLSTTEVEERLRRYGYNEVIEKKISPFVRFLRYLWGPIPWMIEVAVILSAVIRHWADFWIILALLMLNAVVGFWHEYKADTAIGLLKQKLALIARALRDGRWREVLARVLVPGDIVRIRLGEIVPADVKLFDGDGEGVGYLLVDESALTGESLPVEKHTGDMSYAGSAVRQGEMDALVVATGQNTFFGKTAKLVEEAVTESHFQRAIIRIGDYLIAIAIALVLMIFLVALFRSESILDTLQFALVLTVAAIPVALPAVLSVTMAVGALVLAKKEAIVSKLVAIEEMAGMDVLCADKTGTITENKLTLADVRYFERYTADDVLLFGALTSREEDQDPIDIAIVTKTKRMATIAEKLGKYRIIGFKPFDPVSKRAEATIEDVEGNRFKVAKGAPQVILSLMADKESVSAKVDEYVNGFAARGYRALGVAKTEHGNWRYVGIIPLYDPPRQDSLETIKTAQLMGVDVKMVTGDHIAIAKEIARQVGLGTNIITANDFIKKSDREAGRVVENADGFAQVFPEHKYDIVEILQNKGHIVGMTGDGVNDAPALKKADAGIAVSGATDVAKSAADIVFTGPGISVIIDAIKESRKIFQRMNNYAIYRISETIRVLFFITASIVAFQFYPVTALMIVLLALLNDVPIITIASDNVRYSGKPERWNMRTLLGIATILGLFGVASSFGLFYVGLRVLALSREVIQSFIYLKLSVAGHLMVFIARTRGHFWTTRPSTPLFLAIVATQTVATLITVYGFLLPAMGWTLAIFVWGYALLLFVITDFIKVRAYDLLNHSRLAFHR